MGMWADLRSIRRSSQQLAEASGRPSSTIGRIAQVPSDLAWSAEAAGFAATQAQQQAADHGEAIPGGIAGEASLVGGFRATGELAGYLPVGDLTLDIEVPGRPPYRQDVRLVVPHQQLTRMTNGRRFRVQVDPTDPARVRVDW
ncbi:MAG: hypothetical protein R2754_02625 [Microthrixaceae bacterium]